MRLFKSLGWISKRKKIVILSVLALLFVGLSVSFGLAKTGHFSMLADTLNLTGNLRVQLLPVTSDKQIDYTGILVSVRGPGVSVQNYVDSNGSASFFNLPYGTYSYQAESPNCTAGDMSSYQAENHQAENPNCPSGDMSCFQINSSETLLSPLIYETAPGKCFLSSNNPVGSEGAGSPHDQIAGGMPVGSEGAGSPHDQITGGMDFRSIGPGWDGQAGSWKNINEVFAALGGASQSNIKWQLVTTTFMGVRLSINRKILGPLKQVESDIKSSGVSYKIRQGKETGAFNWRPNENDKSKISPHATGLAIDINAYTNPNQERASGCKPRDPSCCPHDIPKAVSDAFEKNGFFWGAKFLKNCDAMHFQYGGNWD